MVNENNWVVKCDNCGKEYNVQEDKSSRIEELRGEEKLILDNNPQCPYCHTQNSRIATKV
ncbi:MAG: hypothetical protein ACXVHW_03725 [Methanobacterium sp.]